MAYKTGLRTLLVATIFVSLTLTSCSKSDPPPTAAVETKPMTEQAKEAIQDYGRRPINKARMTQELGDQRTEAMDAAINATVGK